MDSIRRAMSPALLWCLIIAFLVTAVALAGCGGGAYRPYNVALNPEAVQAEAAFTKADYEQALVFYKKALAHYEEAGEERGVLLCLEKMGWIQREVGEYGEALELFRKAYPLGRKLHGDAAEIDADLGDVYLFSGDSERARVHYRSALDTLNGFVFKTTYSRPPGAEEKAEMTRKVKAIVHARDNLGTLHYFAGEYEQAMEHLRAADALIERVLFVANHRLYGMFFQPPPDLYEGIGFCQTLMGATLGEMGRLDEAWVHFDAGRKAFQQAKRPYGLMINRALRYKIEFLAGNVGIREGDLAPYDRLLEEADRFGALDLVWRMGFEIGRALAREGRCEQARGYLVRAVEALETTRARLREDTIKKMFASSVQDVYEETIELLFTMGRFEEGFDYLERAKARAFLDMLVGRSLAATKGVDALLIQKEQELQRRIDILARKLRTMLGSRRQQAYEAYQKQLKERRRVLEAIKGQSLEYASTTTVTTVRGRRIAERLGDRTALVSFFAGRDRVLAWVVRNGTFSAVAADLGRKALSGLVSDYRDAIAAQRRRRVEELGGRLSKALLHPIQEQIRDAERLFIVPSRSLHYLPFATLPVSKGRFLIEEHTIRMLPNASSLFFLDKEVSRDVDRLLAMGNPERTERAEELAFAEKEVNSIAKRFARPDVRIGVQASETALKESDLVGVGVIHIAAHGRYDRREPLKSALLLASDGRNDGNLEMVEVFSLKMNPRLVVLSACESGIGALEGGDEVQGLNRAFLYAGAGGVLASLWSVSDESAFRLMERFYRELKSAPAGEALRKAQLHLMETSPEPFHWGAFYLTGLEGR